MVVIYQSIIGKILIKLLPHSVIISLHYACVERINIDAKKSRVPVVQTNEARYEIRYPNKPTYQHFHYQHPPYILVYILLLSSISLLLFINRFVWMAFGEACVHL